MDCFCGSGSTLDAAQKLNRKFIGVDQSQVAINVATKNLHDFELIQLSNDESTIFEKEEVDSQLPIDFR